MEEKFSLKDYLFNRQKVTKIAHKIGAVYPAFSTDEFIAAVVNKFHELELKQRVTWIAENFRTYLPDGYREATTILLKSLPDPNDPTKEDNDFGEYIYVPYAEFIAKYGCNKADLPFSLTALKEITQRVSAEDAIRYFINAYPEETIAELLKWTKDPHYQVRRLTSEGTRPKLPWSQKITISADEPIPILDHLYSDKTRYVTRSVANHMNDISKSDPELVLKTLKRWQESNKQNPKEMEYIINHSLRTLIKQGYPAAFTFLNYANNPEVKLTNFEIKDRQIKMGTALDFSFSLTAFKDEKVLVDYLITFQNKKGEMTSKKVFKLKKISLIEGESIHIHKTHLLREKMTTRTIYPGKHNLEIQVNGKILATETFEVIMPAGNSD